MLIFRVSCVMAYRVADNDHSDSRNNSFVVDSSMDAFIWITIILTCIWTSSTEEDSLISSSLCIKVECTRCSLNRLDWFIVSWYKYSPYQFFGIRLHLLCIWVHMLSNSSIGGFYTPKPKLTILSCRLPKCIHNYKRKKWKWHMFVFENSYPLPHCFIESPLWWILSFFLEEDPPLDRQLFNGITGNSWLINW